MKDSVASMITNGALFTARRPDGKKHQPKVLNTVVLESKVGATVTKRNTIIPHTVWRGGRQYQVVKGGLVPV